MAFTEFCCDSSAGSNLNAGTRTGNSTVPTTADFTYASGNWVQSTGVFTVASGNPQSDGVAVGDFASVYPDGSTVAVFIGRVTARSTTTITVSLTAKSGTAPTDGTGNRTLKIGGAWAGPSGSSGFPFGFITNALTNSAGDLPRVNLKNIASFSPTSAMTHNQNGIWFEGFTTSYGDGGRATIDASTNQIDVLTVSAASNAFVNLKFLGSASAGASRGIVATGAGNFFGRCVLTGFRNEGAGITNYTTWWECESYGNNTSNTSAKGGWVVAGPSKFLRCISHDNTGSNSAGWVVTSEVFLNHCIAETNGSDGINISGSGVTFNIHNCDFYNNTGDGIDLSNTSQIVPILIENCNFAKNGGYGINGSGSGTRAGYVYNCGYGAGTYANTSGTTTGLKGITESGAVTYASNISPWVDEANGDFRITLSTAKGAGRGSFLQTASSYAGAIGYPDIGSNQHQDSGSGGGSGNTRSRIVVPSHYAVL